MILILVFSHHFYTLWLVIADIVVGRYVDLFLHVLACRLRDFFELLCHVVLVHRTVEDLRWKQNSKHVVVSQNLKPDGAQLGIAQATKLS